jgi:hypothetical protein
VKAAFLVTDPETGITVDVLDQFFTIRGNADCKLLDEDYKHLNQTLVYAGKEFQVICQNAVTANMSSRVAKSMKVFLLSQEQTFKAKDTGRLVKFYMDVMKRKFKPTDAAYKKLWESLSKHATDITKDAMEEKVQEDLEKYARLPLDDLDGKTRKHVVFKKWPEYLPWLYDILCYTTSSLRQEAARKARARAFSILPVITLEGKFVTINNTILWGFLQRIHKKYTGPCPGKANVFKNVQDIEWQRNFCVKPQSMQNGRKKFARFIKTNGASVSVHYKLQKKKEKKKQQPHQQGSGGNSGPQSEPSLQQPQGSNKDNPQLQQPHLHQQQDQAQQHVSRGNENSMTQQPQEPQAQSHQQDAGSGSGNSEHQHCLQQPFQPQSQTDQHVPRVGVGTAAPRVGVGTTAPRVGVGTAAPRVGVGTAAPHVGVVACVPRVGIGTKEPSVGVGASAQPAGFGSGTAVPSGGVGHLVQPTSFGTDPLLFGGPHQPLLPRPCGFGVVHYLDNKRVVGVDPGRRHIVHCATRDIHGATHVFRVTNGEYK